MPSLFRPGRYNTFSSSPVPHHFRKRFLTTLIPCLFITSLLFAGGSAEKDSPEERIDRVLNRSQSWNEAFLPPVVRRTMADGTIQSSPVDEEETARKESSAGSDSSPSEASFSDSPEQHTFDTLFAAALSGNHELRGLEIDREKSVVDLAAAKAAKFPKVRFSGTLTHIANPMEAVTMTAGSFGSMDVGGQSVLMPPEDVVVFAGSESMNYDFKITVDQPLLTWGKINNGIAALEAGTKAAALQQTAQKEQIKTTLTVYLYSLQLLRNIEINLEQQKELTSRLIHIARESWKNGFILETDFLSAQVKGEELTLNEFRLRDQQDRILLDLEHLCGLAELEIDDIDLTSLDLDPSAYPVNTAESYLDEARNGNTNMELMRLLIDVSDMRLAIARGNPYLLPDIALHFELGYSGPRLPLLESGWYGKDDWNLTSTLALQSTLYDGGKLATDTLVSRREADKARYDYENALNEIEKYIVTASYELKMSLQNIEYYRLKAKNDALLVEQQRKLMETGYGDENQHLTKQLEYLSGLSLIEQEKINWFTHYFSLMSICGRMR